MTNEEAAMLVNGNGGEQPQAAAGNSEPKAAGTVAQETPATVAGATDAGNKDTVNPKQAEPKAPETKGDAGKDSIKAKNFYSQARAQHEFKRQTRRMQALQRENEELKAQLEKFKGTTRETFVDKVSGKLDEEEYVKFLATKAATEQQSARVEKEAKELQDEQEESAWYERVERELGEGSEKFNDFCSEIVDDQGNTRFALFTAWLERRDPQQVIASRINADKNGVKLLQKLMTDKDARMGVINAGTPHQMEMALDRVAESLNGAKAGKPGQARQTFAETWRAHRKETKAPEKPKPSGSAFSGETKSAGPQVKDNNYFASLL